MIPKTHFTQNVPCSLFCGSYVFLYSIFDFIKNSKMGSRFLGDRACGSVDMATSRKVNSLVAYVICGRFVNNLSFWSQMMEKGPRGLNQIVTIFFIRPRGGHIGFQNGRHFQHILAYISISEPKNEVKMRAAPMFVISWIAIKVLRKLLVISLLAAILDFKMAAIFNIFWPIFQLLSSSGAQNGGNAYAYDTKACNKSTWKVAGCCFLGGHLNFKNGRHLDFKMAAIFKVFWTISQLLS